MNTLEAPIEDVSHLQQPMRDLVSLMTLAALWVGADWLHVTDTLLDALLEMLHLDFVYLRLDDGNGETSEATRLIPSMGDALQPVAIGQALLTSLGGVISQWPAAGCITIGASEFSIASAPMLLRNEIGIVVAGSRRPDFASETERLLLGVAANQAALALREARLLDAQGGVARDLEQQLVQRTAELAQVSEALQHEVAERQRSEETLRASEREYREIVDNIPTLVSLLTPSGDVELINRQIIDFTGRTKVELAKWGMSDLVHPDDLTYARDAFKQGVTSAEPFDIFYRMRRHNGAYRWFEALHRPLKNDDGQVARWCVSLNDVDDRKRIEDALREAERAWRSVIDGIPGLTATLSPVGMVEAVNRQIVDYTGCELDELRYWGTNGIVHPDDMPNVAEIFTRSIAAGAPYEIEQRLRRFDGAYRWFSNRGTPARDPAGNVVRWYVLLVDVDEKKRTEEALRTSEREARLIVDTIPAGVVTFTPNGELQGANKHLLEYFGQSFDALRKWTASDLAHPDDLPSLIEFFRGWVTSGESGTHEVRIRRFDGAYRWFQVRNGTLRGADGRVLRVYGLLTDVHDRKRAEESVAAREQELHLIVNTIPGLVAIFAPDGAAEGVNEQFLDYLGQTLAEFANWPRNGTVHPDDVQRHVEVLARSFETGQPIDTETRLRRSDGAYRWFQVRGLPARGTDGHIDRWYCLMSDVDDRKRSDEAVAASERNLQFTIDAIPTLAWSARADGTAEFLNRHYLDYVGQSLTDLTGWGWTSAVHPDDLGPLTAVWQAATTSGSSGDFEARLRGADGKYRWFLFRARPLRDEQGNIVKWYGANTDIEDRKLAEEELRRSEASLADAQSLSSVGSFSWLLETNEVTFSDELYRIFEFDRELPVTLEQIAERIDPADLPLLIDKQKLARSGINDHDYDIRLRMPDGRTKYLRSMSRTGAEPDGEKVFQGTVQDVTQRRLAEEALNELRSELAYVSRVSTLGAMTASIAHEVNQPLSGIITNASTSLRMLASDPPNIEGARETARRTIRDGNRAAEVVARLRALFTKRAVAAEPVDLNEAARDIVALSVSELRRGRANLESQLADDLPLVSGDRIQLQQVILNLLLNASDALSSIDDRPRQIILKTNQDEDGNVRLTVQDNGVGIDLDNSTKLFDAFYTTKAAGMGIGLSVSRTIIDHHGGRIWASANAGPGATFSFTIPRAGHVAHSRADGLPDPNHTASPVRAGD